MASSKVLRWKDLVARYANQFGVPLSVVLGIMEIESGGNPAARSKAGALGLMQVMPSNFGRGEDGMDPETNIRKGVQMLADRYKRYGNWDSAAASYFGAVDSKGNPTTASDVNGVTGQDYVRQFRLSSSRYAGLDGSTGSTGSTGAAMADGDQNGGFGGGIDSTIADLYKQRQNEKKKVDAALGEWQKEEAAARGALQYAAGPGGWDKSSQEYADLVERVNKATSRVAYYKTASQQLIDSMQKLESEYVSATNKAATQALQYANKSNAAGLQGRKDYLAEAIALGKITTDQARLAWDEAQDVARNWQIAVQQGYSAAAQLLPRMAFQEDINALWEDLKGVSATGRYTATGPAPRAIPLEAVLTPYMDAIKQYMPPANAIDWKRVMTIPSGLGTPTISQREYEEGARAQLEMPAAIAPLPEGGYTGGEEFVAGPPPVVQPATPRMSAEELAAKKEADKWARIQAAAEELKAGMSYPQMGGPSEQLPSQSGYNWPGIEQLWNQMGMGASATPEGEEPTEGLIEAPPTGDNWQSAYGGRPETPLQEWYRLHPGQLPPQELLGQ